MKVTIRLTKIILLTLIGFTTLYCSDRDGNPPLPEPQNIVEIAVNEPDLSNLVAALSAADGDLASLLSGGNYTLLAPTNFAFDLFLTANGFASLDEVPSDLLRTILLNHVISGSVSSTDLINANSGYTTTNATNLDGDNLSLYYDTSDGVQFNGFSSVVLADLVGSNGIVHIVNEVIGLPTVATFATSNPEFSTLVSALTREDHSTDYVSVLSSNTEIATVTVFAPTNTAFESFFSELELDSINVIPLPILEATLDTHLVYNANVRSEDLTDSMSIATVGTPLTVSLSVGPQLIDSQGRVANIIAVDVQAYNGVIHVIDKVVFPDLP